MSIFSIRLSELRKSNKISQNELAKAIKIGRSTLANYEQGIREPSFDTLKRIADYFDVDLDYLIGWSKEKQSILRNIFPDRKSGIGNKKIFRINLEYYIKLKNRSIRDISRDLNIDILEIGDWLYEKSYPKIAELKLLSEYFGILQAELVEPKEKILIQFEERVQLEKDIKNLAKNNIERELLIRCTILNNKQQKIILQLIKMLNEIEDEENL